MISSRDVQIHAYQTSAAILKGDPQDCAQFQSELLGGIGRRVKAFGLAQTRERYLAL